LFSFSYSSIRCYNSAEGSLIPSWLEHLQLIGVRGKAAYRKRKEAINRRTYAGGGLRLRQSGTLFFNCVRFSALRAEKPHTRRTAGTLLPQAKCGFMMQNDATA
jgi:hypothetical protein